MCLKLLIAFLKRSGRTEAAQRDQIVALCEHRRDRCGKTVCFAYSRCTETLMFCGLLRFEHGPLPRGLSQLCQDAYAKLPLRKPCSNLQSLHFWVPKMQLRISMGLINQKRRANYSQRHVPRGPRHRGGHQRCQWQGMGWKEVAHPKELHSSNQRVLIQLPIPSTVLAGSLTS